MKAGDLVVMAEEKDPLGRVGSLVGIVVDSKIVRNRISVLWPNANGKVSYEPIMFLEVVGE